MTATMTNPSECLNHLLVLKNHRTIDCDPNLSNHINKTLDCFTQLIDEHTVLESTLDTFFFNIEGLLKTSPEELQPAYTSVLKLAEELNLR